MFVVCKDFEDIVGDFELFFDGLLGIGIGVDNDGFGVIIGVVEKLFE